MKKPILLTLLALLVAAFALFCLAVLLAGLLASLAFERPKHQTGSQTRTEGAPSVA